MAEMAKVTSKGQVTVPLAIREAMGIGTGDRLRFEVDGDAIRVSKARDLAELAGSVPIPDELRDARWEQIREVAHREWAIQSERRGRGAG